MKGVIKKNFIVDKRDEQPVPIPLRIIRVVPSCIARSASHSRFSHLVSPLVKFQSLVSLPESSHLRSMKIFFCPVFARTTRLIFTICQHDDGFEVPFLQTGNVPIPIDEVMVVLDCSLSFFFFLFRLAPLVIQ